MKQNIYRFLYIFGIQCITGKSIHANIFSQISFMFRKVKLVLFNYSVFSFIIYKFVSVVFIMI